MGWFNKLFKIKEVPPFKYGDFVLLKKSIPDGATANRIGREQRTIIDVLKSKESGVWAVRVAGDSKWYYYKLFELVKS